MTIFKACDIRGVVGVEWETAEARCIGRSLGRMLRRRGQTTLCVGGDFRRTTPPLKQALIEGLTGVGASVLDVGQLPTPAVYFAARHLACANLAVVTASHNPGQYNGIKFLIGGRPAVPELMEELKSGLDASSERRENATIQQRDVVPAYERWVVERAGILLDAAGLEKRETSEPRVTGPSPDDRRQGEGEGEGGGGGGGEPLRVVLDTMDGAFTFIAPRVLATTGCQVHAICSDVDPDFQARSPNPANDANLDLVAKRLKEQDVDLAIALDGDGDRVVFIASNGRIVRPEQLAVLLVRYCFQKPTVVFDLKCASIVCREVEAAGGTAIMRPSGHGFIKTTMIEQQAELGVEVSGHHFFGALDGGDDGLFTALVLLGLLERTGKRLADLIQPIGWPTITPDVRIPYRGDAGEALARIAASCGGTVTRLDGVRAEYADGWALARTSITEPAITLRFEGRDRNHLQTIAARFLAKVPDLSRQVMEWINSGGSR